MVDEELPLANLEDAERQINYFIVPEPRTLHRWVIVKKVDGIPIGTCGCHFWDVKDHICEIGCDLAPEFWGKGYMIEALRRVIDFGFDKMELNRIQAFTLLENTRAVRLLLRLGFKQEGIYRDKELCRGVYYDHFQFSLLKREWSKA